MGKRTRVSVNSRYMDFMNTEYPKYKQCYVVSGLIDV